MTQAINQKVLSKSGRSLVKHGYWKTKTSEGVWVNGKQIGKHIYFRDYDPNTISSITLFTNTGDGNRILEIEYKNKWHGDDEGNVFWVLGFDYKSKGNEWIAHDFQYNNESTNYDDLELIEELLDANHEILMGCISAH
jgi:hypothetical protein